MDERLRSLERGDDARWVAEALRVGRVTRAEARAAAHLGHAGARAWFEAGPRRPRWAFPVLASWTPAPESLTDRVTAPGLEDVARVDLVRAAAAEAALGRLELPSAEGAEIESLPQGRRRVWWAGESGACLLLRWLLSVALDDERVRRREDLAAVAELLWQGRLMPLQSQRPQGLPRTAGAVLRGWTFKRRGGPSIHAIEATSGVAIVEAERRSVDDRIWWRALPEDPDKPRVARRLAGRTEPWTFLARSACFDGLGDPEEAERVLTEGLALTPGNNDLLQVRGELLVMAGDPRAAAEDFRALADRAEGPAARCDALVARSRALLAADLPAEALEVIEGVIPVRSNSHALVVLAQARRLSGDAAGALLAAKGALERAPWLEGARREVALAERALGP